jgi:hypothetical protein
MRTRSRPGWFAFDLRVNGRVFEEVALRLCAHYPFDSEILVRDCHLGCFALHEEFQLKTPDVAPISWRPVTLSELKRMAATHAHRIGIDPLVPCETDLSGQGVTERASGETFERIPVEGDSSHHGRAERALTQAGMSFEVIGGRDSRGRIGGNVTLAVTSLDRAFICLHRAGFLEAPESKYVLIDSKTGWRIRFLTQREIDSSGPGFRIVQMDEPLL